MKTRNMIFCVRGCKIRLVNNSEICVEFLEVGPDQKDQKSFEKWQDILI